MCVRAGPSEGLQVSHEWTRVSTSFGIELDILGGSQKLARIYMLQAYGSVPLPVCLSRLGTMEFPVITGIAFAIARAVGRDFLLSREDGLDIVRMQIAPRIDVRETNDGVARDGFCQLTSGFVQGVFLSFDAMIRGTNVPECVHRGGILGEGDNLLSTAVSYLLFFGIQEVFRITMLNFDSRTASDIEMLIVIQVRDNNNYRLEE
jgi:hypothetical protein